MGTRSRSDLAALEAAQAGAAGAVTLPQRLCGRCRQMFDGDPDLYFQTDWALCPSCKEILIPSRSTPEAGRPAE